MFGDATLALRHDGDAMLTKRHDPAQMKKRESFVPRTRTVVPVDRIADAEDSQSVPCDRRAVSRLKSALDVSVAGGDEEFLESEFIFM